MDWGTVSKVNLEEITYKAQTANTCMLCYYRFYLKISYHFKLANTGIT